ncbi:MAG: type II toxin-antitoxin system VapC family toxin [Nitrososphaerales archaeon]
MSFLFDASSIFEALIKGSIRILSGNYTVEIARYELGNILWRRRVLVGDISSDECIRLAVVMEKVLKLMEIMGVGCYETEILKLAEGLKLSFYDSSYVYTAKAKDVYLVTEDVELRKKVEGYIKAIGLDEVMERRL